MSTLLVCVGAIAVSTLIVVWRTATIDPELAMSRLERRRGGTETIDDPWLRGGAPAQPAPLWKRLVAVITLAATAVGGGIMLAGVLAASLAVLALVLQAALG